MKYLKNIDEWCTNNIGAAMLAGLLFLTVTLCPLVIVFWILLR